MWIYHPRHPRQYRTTVLSVPSYNFDLQYVWRRGCGIIIASYTREILDRAKCVIQRLVAMRPTGRGSQNNDSILSSAHETLGGGDTTDDQPRTHEAVGPEATATAEEEGNPRLHGFGSKGTLAAVSSIIDDNLRLFR